MAKDLMSFQSPEGHGEAWPTLYTCSLLIMPPEGRDHWPVTLSFQITVNPVSLYVKAAGDTPCTPGPFDAPIHTCAGSISLC
jgi:hypothetical protein